MTSGTRPQLLAILPGNHAIAVELDVVEPAGTGRRPLRHGGLAWEDEAGRLGTGSDRPGNAPEHTGRRNRLRLPLSEPALVRGLLLAIALAFLGLFLVLP